MKTHMWESSLMKIYNIKNWRCFSLNVLLFYWQIRIESSIKYPSLIEVVLLDKNRDEIINKLVESDQLAEITLHVGAGTFLPIRNEDVDNHVMHSEYGIIDEKTALKINQCKKKGGKIIAVGTTTLRLLESAAKNNVVEKFNTETNIFIKPGYKFQIVDMLLTNFHLPKSTLLLLVSAFAGTEEIFKIYKHAVTNKYRFFSYGDVSLLFKKWAILKY